MNKSDKNQKQKQMTPINDEVISNTSIYTSDQSMWPDLSSEGQLAVDVLQTKNDVIVIASMGGAVADNIEVYARNDVLTIRGKRNPPIPTKEKTEYFHQETVWGEFSRTVVLPVDVKGELAKAEYKNGVLKVCIPKREINAKIVVEIVDE